MCGFTTNHTALRSKNKDWLARNQNNVYPRTVLSVILHFKNPTQRVGLVQSRHHHNFMVCNLLSPWYSWKIAYFVSNNNHSLYTIGNLISFCIYILIYHHTIFYNKTKVNYFQHMISLMGVIICRKSSDRQTIQWPKWSLIAPYVYSSSNKKDVIPFGAYIPMW